MHNYMLFNGYARGLVFWLITNSLVYTLLTESVHILFNHKNMVLLPSGSALDLLFAIFPVGACTTHNS